jgi:hypothetical protein
MDFSFLSKKKNLLLALIEVKADSGRFELLKTSDALRQTLNYLLQHITAGIQPLGYCKSIR